jgi:hypothetical protein
MAEPTPPASDSAAAEDVTANEKLIAAQVAGRLPGTWAHLSQEAALEAALLVVLYVAARKKSLLRQLGQGVEVTYRHM